MRKKVAVYRSLQFHNSIQMSYIRCLEHHRRDVHSIETRQHQVPSVVQGVSHCNHGTIGGWIASIVLPHHGTQCKLPLVSPEMARSGVSRSRPPALSFDYSISRASSSNSTAHERESQNVPTLDLHCTSKIVQHRRNCIASTFSTYHVDAQVPVMCSIASFLVVLITPQSS